MQFVHQDTQTSDVANNTPDNRPQQPCLGDGDPGSSVSNESTSKPRVRGSAPTRYTKRASVHLNGGRKTQACQTSPHLTAETPDGEDGCKHDDDHGGSSNTVQQPAASDPPLPTPDTSSTNNTRPTNSARSRRRPTTSPRTEQTRLSTPMKCARKTASPHFPPSSSKISSISSESSTEAVAGPAEADRVFSSPRARAGEGFDAGSDGGLEEITTAEAAAHMYSVLDNYL